MEALLFIYGIVLGSFYNVVIFRLPEKRSIVRPPSACGACGHRLTPVELIPIFSYILQRGRCKACGSKIAIRYPMVEFLTGVFFVGAYMKFGLTIELFKVLFLGSLFIIISFIDLDHQIIPDGLNLLIGITGLIYLGIMQPFPVTNALYGFLAGGGLLFLIALVGPMGGGDIKFMAAMGIWLGIGYTLMTLLISFIVGGVLSGILLVAKLVDRKTAIPFGPFLCIAALVVLFYGDELFIWYVTTVLS